MRIPPGKTALSPVVTTSIRLVDLYKKDAERHRRDQESGFHYALIHCDLSFLVFSASTDKGAEVYNGFLHGVYYSIIGRVVRRLSPSDGKS